jgi:hypothetical protein
MWLGLWEYMEKTLKRKKFAQQPDEGRKQIGMLLEWR